jgi:hypothetical protein
VLWHLNKRFHRIASQLKGIGGVSFTYLLQALFIFKAAVCHYSFHSSSSNLMLGRNK